MSYFRSVTIQIPNIDNLPDEELALLARENDGRWSSQTKVLLEQFKTSRLDLNLNWAKTCVGWQCPCCSRGKPEIARLSRGGVLRCKLEQHHDHLEDYTRRLFDDINPMRLNSGEYNRQRDIAKDAIVALTARFDRVLICSDCNSAEAEAKRNVKGADKHFTFSPSEIAAFIVPVANHAHEVDGTLAQQKWEAAKADFEDRIDFARRMARRFENGKNRKEIVGVRGDLSFKDGQYYSSALTAADLDNAKGSLARQIEERSIANDGDGPFSVAKPRRIFRGITDLEFQLLERRLVTGREYWLGLGEHWTCECCRRNKREICRISNRGEWTARIHKIRDWEHETTALGLIWRQRSARSVLILRTHRTVYVCQDCRNVVTKLERLHPEVSGDALVPHLLSSVLVVVDANADHIADYDLAFSLAEANRDLVPAIEDYNCHKDLSLDVRYRFKRRVSCRGRSEEQALSAIAEGLVKNGSVLAQDAVEYARWLVSEGFRFEQLIKKEKEYITTAS